MKQQAMIIIRSCSYISAQTPIPMSSQVTKRILSPVEMTHIIEEVTQLTDAEHEQIFKIIKSHSCRYTENLNGVFLNLAHLPTEVLVKVQELLAFWKDQHELFKSTEQQNALLNVPQTDTINEPIVHRSDTITNKKAKSVERQTIFNEQTALSKTFTKDELTVVCGNKDKRTKIALNNNAKQQLLKSGGSALRVAKKCIATEEECTKN